MTRSRFWRQRLLDALEFDLGPEIKPFPLPQPPEKLSVPQVRRWQATHEDQDKIVAVICAQYVGQTGHIPSPTVLASLAAEGVIEGELLHDGRAERWWDGDFVRRRVWSSGLMPDGKPLLISESAMPATIVPMLALLQLRVHRTWLSSLSPLRTFVLSPGFPG